MSIQAPNKGIKLSAEISSCLNSKVTQEAEDGNSNLIQISQIMQEKLQIDLLITETKGENLRRRSSSFIDLTFSKTSAVNHLPQFLNHTQEETRSRSISKSRSMEFSSSPLTIQLPSWALMSRVQFEKLSTVENGLKIETTFNPIYQKVPLNPKIVKERVKAKLSYFLKLDSAIVFNPERAEIELSKCLKEYSAEVVSEVVIELKTKLKPKSQKRLQEVLVLMLSKSENVDFMQIYIDHLQSRELDAFAHEIVAYFIEKRDYAHLLFLASVFTQADLKHQKRETMFREAHFSSSFCKAFGYHLWAKELKNLDIKILHELSKYKDPYLLILDRTLIAEKLRKEGESREECIQQRLIENAERFMTFASTIIPLIYQMNMNQAFAQLLSKRRMHIIAFLEKNPVTPQPNSSESVDHDLDPILASEKYISELLILRMINPHLSTGIISAKTHPEQNRILLQLTMVLQCIANGTMMDKLKGDQYVALNKLIDNFKDIHREFLKKYTLLK